MYFSIYIKATGDSFSQIMFCVSKNMIFLFSTIVLHVLNIANKNITGAPKMRNNS